MRARILALAVAVAALCAAPASAVAHTLSPPSPAAGDGGTTFSFHGRAWQAGQYIQAQYYRRDTDSRPFRLKTFRVGSNGTFAFRLLNPWFYDTGRLQRMCFAQFDTRYSRTFRKCKSFYVGPAYANFMPADGEAGRVFILVAGRFQANRTLDIELTRPDGLVENYTMRTRGRAAFVALPVESDRSARAVHGVREAARRAGAGADVAAGVPPGLGERVGSVL
jgi:hypothetical protein